MIQRIKGTQDLLDLTLLEFILNQAQRACKLSNFTPIITPIIEPLELFKRSLGLHTDVVTKEMYRVVTDASDDENICLRPEATASTVRAFVENNIQVTPWKVYSWGPMFRHERPQKGRFRQFHQFNIEIIGAQAIGHDAALIGMLDRLFSSSLMLQEYALLINFLGTYEDRAHYTKKLYSFLATITDKICETCRIRKEANIMRVFDCKNPTCKELYKKAPTIIDSLSQESQAEWNQLQHELDALSVSYSVDPRLVRGLDYYNKTVFEFVSSDLGAQNAFCGGGRYATLVEAVGGKEDQPAIGAAFGIERLMMMLEPIRNRLPLAQEPALAIIIPMDAEQQTIALLLAQHLHEASLTADILFDGQFKNRLKKANRLGARHVIIIGSEEQQAGTVSLKNMITGTSEIIKQTDVVAALKRM